jgi:hypothetical protein
MASVRYLLLALFRRVVAGLWQGCAVVSSRALDSTGFVGRAGAEGFGFASPPSGAAPCGRSSLRFGGDPVKGRGERLSRCNGFRAGTETDRALAGQVGAAGNVPGLAWNRVLSGSVSSVASTYGLLGAVLTSWRWLETSKGLGIQLWDASGEISGRFYFCLF